MVGMARIMHQPAHFTSIQQLSRNERSLDGLPDTHVIGYQQSDRVKLQAH